MSDGMTVHIDGLAELSNAMKELPDRVARKSLRAAVSAGAAIVRDEMRARAPVYTGSVAQGHPPPGTLKKAVYMKHIDELSFLEKQVYYVGARHGKSRQHVGKKDRNLDAYYFFMVEFGTTKMAARPFMRPAFETRKTAALAAIVTKLGEGISQAAAELRK